MSSLHFFLNCLVATHLSFCLFVLGHVCFVLDLQLLDLQTFAVSKIGCIDQSINVLPFVLITTSLFFSCYLLNKCVYMCDTDFNIEYMPRKTDSPKQFLSDQHTFVLALKMLCCIEHLTKYSYLNAGSKPRAKTDF